MMFAELVKNKLKKKKLPGETDVYEADSETLACDYLQNAAEPGKMPVSFEEATDPEPEKPKELPEPISEKRVRTRKRRK